jgi:hypothetical protein
MLLWDRLRVRALVVVGLCCYVLHFYGLVRCAPFRMLLSVRLSLTAATWQPLARPRPRRWPSGVVLAAAAADAAFPATGRRLPDLGAPLAAADLAAPLAAGVRAAARFTRVADEVLRPSPEFCVFCRWRAPCARVCARALR